MENISIIDKFEVLQNQSLEIAQKCNDIVVKDDSSLSIANNVLKSANKLVKELEAKRKELKQPYVDKGKEIDSYAKKLTEPIQKAVDEGKIKIVSYMAEVEEKAKEEALKKAREESEKKLIIINRMADFEKTVTYQLNGGTYTNSKGKEFSYNGCSTVEQVKEIYDFIEAKFPAFELFGEFAEKASILKSNLKKNCLQKREDIKNGTETETVQSVEVAELENEVMEDSKEQINKDVSTSMSIQKNMRTTWKYEVTDETIINREFLCVDDKRIKEFMKQYADKLSEGEDKTIKGINFFKVKSVAL